MQLPGLVDAPSPAGVRGVPVVETRGKAPAGTGGHRQDIQALRAFAVLAVLAFHLIPGFARGGFVGVDIFFVISGLLITGNLLREAETTGSIRLLRFWAKRARRLFPAAATVMMATAGAVLIWVPQNLWRQYFGEVLASAFYVQNWVLAHNSVDYLAASNSPSPVQHFWTLSVEEQFYLAVPVLLLILAASARLLHLHLRRTLFLALLALTAASLLYGIDRTTDSQLAAYFLTPVRAWEFGVGALLAFAQGTVSRWVGARLMLVGGVALVASVFLLSLNSSFPGWLALWPVLATAAVLEGGRSSLRGYSTFVAAAPLQFLGRISYALYLWHWPMIVLLPFVTGRPLDTQDRLGIAAAAVLLAWLSTKFIEEPVLREAKAAPGRKEALRLTSWCAGAMGAVAAVCALALFVNAVAGDRDADRVKQAVAEHGDCLGAAGVLDATCDPAPLGDRIVPDPVYASTDDANRKDCWSGEEDPVLRVCTLGDPASTIRLAAIGDSHNNALISAYEGVAKQNGWRIDVAGHRGCYWTIGIQKKLNDALVVACEAWKDSVDKWLDGQRPYDAILVTNARDGSKLRVAKGTDLVEATVRGLNGAWAPQERRGVRIFAIRDNPTMHDDVATCVVQWGLAANDHCAKPLSEAVNPGDEVLTATSRSATSRLIDLSSVYCPRGTCLPVIGSVAVYQDRSHLTATFAQTLTGELSKRVRLALGADSS